MRQFETHTTVEWLKGKTEIWYYWKQELQDCVITEYVPNTMQDVGHGGACFCQKILSNQLFFHCTEFWYGPVIPAVICLVQKFEFLYLLGILWVVLHSSHATLNFTGKDWMI